MTRVGKGYSYSLDSRMDFGKYFGYTIRTLITDKEMRTYIEWILKHIKGFRLDDRAKRLLYKYRKGIDNTITEYLD